MAKRLTVKGIPQLPAGRHGDGNTLHLLVQPTGLRSWVQRVTIGGRRVDRGLGPWPAVTLAQARDLAFRNRVTARTIPAARMKARAESIGFRSASLLGPSWGL